MAKINLLDDTTINKIAAGEVIEKPSSIIKELVENSIDASSTAITVEVENGGKDLIKIIDNGSGIEPDDVNKAFMRHATSKINRAEDLYNLYSLGFRGEALASIAAVSKLKMITKTSNELTATEIAINGGKVVSKNPCAGNNGTQIIVNSLFYNTPARRKFLKSNQAESQSITDLMNKLAIGNPSIKFKYVNNKKTIFETQGDDEIKNIIRTIHGKNITENLIEVSYNSPFFRLYGFIANNNVYRSNRNMQYIFVNGRYIKSSNIMNIINESYKSIIPINKFPIYFLFLEMDPSKIDVNIHPNKLDIKFDNESAILNDIGDYVRGMLMKNSLIGKYTSSNKLYDETSSLKQYHTFTYDCKEDIKNNYVSNTDDKDISSSNDIYNQDISYNESDKAIYNKNINDNFRDEIKALNIYENINSKINIDDKYEQEIKSHKLNEYTSESNNDTYELNKYTNKSDNDTYELIKQNKYDGYSEFVKKDKSQTKEITFFDDEPAKNHDFKNLNFVGILFDTYIMFSKGDNMIMMDQHAAHERVRFEMYMDNFKNSNISIQLLVEPILMELSISDIDLVISNIDLFKKFGFLIEEYGVRNIRIYGVPNTFGIPESETFVYEIIDNLEKIDNVYDTKYDEIAEIACKSAIKANDKINFNEVKELVKQLECCENPYTCPHGRPIMTKLTKYEIEKMFKRKM